MKKLHPPADCPPTDPGGHAVPAGTGGALRPEKAPYLSPSSAIAAAEQDLACGPTEVLAQRQEGEATFLLSWNDQVLLAKIWSLLPSGGATYCLANPCTAPTGPGTPSKGSRPRASGFTTRTPVGVGGSGPAWSAAGRRRSLSASPGRKRRNPWRRPSSPLGRETSTSGSTILTQGEALCPSYTQITLLDEAGHALTTAPITNPEHFTIISPSQGGCRVLGNKKDGRCRPFFSSMGGDALRLGLVLVHRFVGEVQGELVPAVGAGDFPDVQDVSHR